MARVSRVSRHSRLACCCWCGGDDGCSCSSYRDEEGADSSHTHSNSLSHHADPRSCMSRPVISRRQTCTFASTTCYSSSSSLHSPFTFWCMHVQVRLRGKRETVLHSPFPSLFVFAFLMNRQRHSTPLMRSPLHGSGKLVRESDSHWWGERE